ncbi:MAG: hypothetical protein JW717_14545 [Marinilabiliaceae bacterium]|nr:hypothetical protein [Marinilabiliaceae bacterium]
METNTATEENSTLISRLDALYEFDREPVSEKKLHGWKTFIGMFSGEHIAGTEFVLGFLLFQHGVSGKDLILGLLIGNLLAVLSWAFFCAPVGVKTRLTIYWLIRKVCDPYITVIYSALYALILCLLAGSMVYVAVTSISIPFGVQNPNYPTDVIPNLPWIIIAVVIGTIIALLAVLGFEKIAHFAKVCAPWMALVFLACAIAALPAIGINSLNDFWQKAPSEIFKGVPLNGYSQYTIWHVIGLAWLCNAPQHIGMSDITIFRYAKSWKQGFASAFGMYIGHFGAWISSYIMVAVYLKVIGSTSPQPGDVAYFAAGLAGAVCVVVAGWTTANPTLYRTGLAIQVLTPNWKRWKVTLAAGILMIIAACIPAVVHNLDRLVAYNGIAFVPLGAFIFVDLWILPKMGLESYYTEKKRSMISWPAGTAWILSFFVCWFLYAKDNFEFLSSFPQPNWLANIKADLMYLLAPEWALAVILYLLFSYLQQKSSKLKMVTN